MQIVFKFGCLSNVHSVFTIPFFFQFQPHATHYQSIQLLLNYEYFQNDKIVCIFCLNVLIWFDLNDNISNFQILNVNFKILQNVEQFVAGA